MVALRNYYCPPNLRELHKLQLHNLKFDHKNGSPEDFLVQVQTKATLVYPDPAFPPIPPADRPNSQAEIDRVQQEQVANQATLDNTFNDRIRRIQEILTNSMPNFMNIEFHVTGIIASVRNYLEPCLSANVCKQFMDDIGCGVESIGTTVTQFTTHLKMVTQIRTQTIARELCL